jgi:hypothetical protein
MKELREKAEDFYKNYRQQDRLEENWEYQTSMMTDFYKHQFKKDIESKQRELIKKWWKYFDEESVAVNCNKQEREEVINNFFNCS